MIQDALSLMRVGMLWLMPDNQKPLAEKITMAALYYQRKYGQPPTVCYFNNQEAGNAPESLIDETKGLSITLHSSSVILPRHLWIGTEDKKADG